MTQTIANGSTVADITDWRAVYDANGDGTEDDPGSIQFLIDGTQVLSEINAPFGDTFATGSPSASAGQHTFLVRALSDSGTLLATNSVTATVVRATSTAASPASSSTAASAASSSAAASSAAATPTAHGLRATGVPGRFLHRGSHRHGADGERGDDDQHCRNDHRRP